jgi:hypothetical protein
MYSEYFLVGLGPILAAIITLAAGGRAKGWESRHGPTGSLLLWGANQSVLGIRIRIRICIRIRIFFALPDLHLDSVDWLVITHKYGSGSGSFHHQAKKVRKTLISTVL